MFAAAPPAIVDLALNKLATASSSNASTRLPAKAVDGDSSTRWASSVADGQWLQVDLGATSTIVGVKVDWEYSYAKGYKLQVSDNGTTWTDIYSTTTSDGKDDRLYDIDGVGRYVRLQGVTRGTTGGISLYNFNVYGYAGQPAENPPSEDAYIGGYVFDDVDNDGVRDAGEAGLSGYVVYNDRTRNGQYDYDAGEIASVTTASGAFGFGHHLQPGLYYLRVQLESGDTTKTPQPQLVRVEIGQSKTDVMIAVHRGPVAPPRVGTLNGYAFDDLNDNGQPDAGEAPVDAIIFLDANDDGLLSSGERQTRTNASGYYEFTNLAPGRHDVGQIEQSGNFQLRSGRLDYQYVQAGETSPLNFSYFTTLDLSKGSLTGYVFNDTNANGYVDGQETYAGGKTVFLDADNDGELDASEKQTITAAGTGAWKFENLPAGTYHVRRVFPSGFTYSTQLINFQLAANQQAGTFTIGSRTTSSTPPKTGSISGYTFNDSDKDGVLDATETKAGGKTVFLDANNNGKLDTGERQQITAANGSYAFTGLTAGTYRVRRVFPSGFTYSTQPIDLLLSEGQSITNAAIGSRTV
ncbi:MAG TPA: SdrD B-like domain-containing protein [Tepidisphaeraceae bacterium]